MSTPGAGQRFPGSERQGVGWLHSDGGQNPGAGQQLALSGTVWSPLAGSLLGGFGEPAALGIRCQPPLGQWGAAGGVAGGELLLL